MKTKRFKGEETISDRSLPASQEKERRKERIEEERERQGSKTTVKYNRKKVLQKKTPGTLQIYKSIRTKTCIAPTWSRLRTLFRNIFFTSRISTYHPPFYTHKGLAGLGQVDGRRIDGLGWSCHSGPGGNRPDRADPDPWRLICLRRRHVDFGGARYWRWGLDGFRLSLCSVDDCLALKQCQGG